MTHRGSCTDPLCGCTQFISSEDIDGANCLQCNHSAGAHESVTEDISQNPVPRTADTQKRGFWSSISAALSRPRRTRIPSPAASSPDQLCSLPGCTRRRDVDLSTGKPYEHCGKAHYLEHQRSLAVGVPAHLRCKTPNCPRQRNPIPGGSGYYDYCCITCRDSAAPLIPATPRMPSVQLCCSLPGCSRPRDVDPSTGKLYEHCGKMHYLEHQRSLAVGVPAHLRCKTPNCPRQRNPIPGGSGYYDYCCITCRDSVSLSPDQLCILPGCTLPKHVDLITGKSYDHCGRIHYLQHQRRLTGSSGSDTLPAHLRCKTPNCPRQRNPIPGGSGYYDYCSINCRDSGGRAVTHAIGRTIAGSERISCRLLQARSAEYRSICSKFRNDWAKGACPAVDFVLEVDCLALKRRWEDFTTDLATRGSPTTVEEHYHGTFIKCDLAGTKSLCADSSCAICGISTVGFKKNLIGTNISRFKRFGHGFYLAPHSSKCHDYTRGSHTHRAMLLCDVLPGTKHVVTTDQTHLTTPPPGYDSVYGQPGGSLNYPEIVLYDEESILPRYVIMYQMDGVGKIAQ